MAKPITVEVVDKVGGSLAFSVEHLAWLPRLWLHAYSADGMVWGPFAAVKFKPPLGTDFCPSFGWTGQLPIMYPFFNSRPSLWLLRSGVLLARHVGSRTTSPATCGATDTLSYSTTSTSACSTTSAVACGVTRKTLLAAPPVPLPAVRNSRVCATTDEGTCRLLQNRQLRTIIRAVRETNLLVARTLRRPNAEVI